MVPGSASATGRFSERRSSVAATLTAVLALLGAPSPAAAQEQPPPTAEEPRRLRLDMTTPETPAITVAPERRSAGHAGGHRALPDLPDRRPPADHQRQRAVQRQRLPHPWRHGELPEGRRHRPDQRAAPAVHDDADRRHRAGAGAGVVLDVDGGPAARTGRCRLPPSGRCIRLSGGQTIGVLGEAFLPLVLKTGPPAAWRRAAARSRRLSGARFASGSDWPGSRRPPRPS